MPRLRRVKEGFELFKQPPRMMMLEHIFKTKEEIERSPKVSFIIRITYYVEI